MTHAGSRSRLDAIEANARRSGIGEAVGSASALKTRLTLMATRMIDDGCAWQSYEPAALAATHAALVATAANDVADDEARAEAVLNGAPPVHWEQTPEQRAASIDSITRRVRASRSLLKLLTAVCRVIGDDDPNREPASHGKRHPSPSSMSLAEFVALAMTAGLSPEELTMVTAPESA